jgi:peptidylprolyl isomerase
MGSFVRRLLALLLAALLMLATAACSDSGADPKDKISGLTVTGAFGDEPKVSVKPSVKVDHPETEVITEGKGAKVSANEQTLLNVLVAKGSDGSTLLSSKAQGGPITARMADGQFFGPVIDGVVGQRAGSRVAIAGTVTDFWGAAGAPQTGLKKGSTVVMVVDVLSTEPDDVLDGPQGQHVDPPANAPRIVESGGTITGVDTSSAGKPPSKLEVIPLVQGDGKVIDGPSIVTVNYLGQVWGADKPFNNSYSSGPTAFTVGVGQLVPAWDKALQGVHAGSRVMLVVPPKDGYGSQGNPGIKVSGTDDMVFLIDVLGVG